MADLTLPRRLRVAPTHDALESYTPDHTSPMFNVFGNTKRSESGGFAGESATPEAAHQASSNGRTALWVVLALAAGGALIGIIYWIHHSAKESNKKVNGAGGKGKDASASYKLPFTNRAVAVAAAASPAPATCIDAAARVREMDRVEQQQQPAAPSSLHAGQWSGLVGFVDHDPNRNMSDLLRTMDLSAMGQFADADRRKNQGPMLSEAKNAFFQQAAGIDVGIDGPCTDNLQPLHDNIARKLYKNSYMQPGLDGQQEVVSIGGFLDDENPDNVSTAPIVRASRYSSSEILGKTKKVFEQERV